MAPTWFLIMCEISVIGTMLVSGLFLTFSSFLMRSLALSQTAAGIEVMQVINREIWKSAFIALLWGFILITAGLAGYAYLYIPAPATAYLITGAALYFFGVFVMSYLFNIPMNDRLDALAYDSEQAATYWHSTYLPRWTYWNYLRALTSGGAAVCFLAASVQLVQGG